MFKDEFTGYPRSGKNIIDKVKLKIFVPILAFFGVFEAFLRFVMLYFR